MPEKEHGQLDERKKLANRIKQARKNSHISQRALGKSIGVSDKSISAYEHARSMPPLNQLTKIALRTRKPLPFFVEGKTAKSTLTRKLQSVEQELKEIHALLDTISKNKDNRLTEVQPGNTNEDRQSSYTTGRDFPGSFLGRTRRLSYTDMPPRMYRDTSGIAGIAMHRKRTRFILTRKGKLEAINDRGVARDVTPQERKRFRAEMQKQVAAHPENQALKEFSERFPLAKK